MCGVEGWVDLDSWLHNEVVNPPEVDHLPCTDRAWLMSSLLFKLPTKVWSEFIGFYFRQVDMCVCVCMYLYVADRSVRTV